MGFLLKDRKMLLSSSKPIMICTRGMPGIPLNRESVPEEVRRVLESLPLFIEMDTILRERNLNAPSGREISDFRVNLFADLKRESGIRDVVAFFRSLREEIGTPLGRSRFSQRIQDLHAQMSAEGNWDDVIARQGGRGYFNYGNLPNPGVDGISPLDQFSIHPIWDLHIGNFFISFTNVSLDMMLTLGFVLFLVFVVTKKGGGKLVPNAWQSLVELIYDFVLNLVNEQIGGLSGNVKQKFFPCILVTFTFLLFCNLQGMIPFSFTVTSHFLITLALSFSLFIGITIVGFQRHGLHFFSFLLPAGVPLPLAPFLVLLELISYCFRALSLGIRLFANMMAGHSLVKILSGFAWTMLFLNNIFYFIGDLGPLLIVLALTGLELGVAILQAYVFTILICIYLNDAINLH